MTAQEIINQWHGMNGEEQYRLCRNCVGRVINQGYKLRPGYDFDDATQSTYERMIGILADPDKLDAYCKRRELEGKTEITLAAVGCRAARNTMGRISYHANKEAKATSRTVTNEAGEEIDVLDTIASADNTEESAITRATLQQFIKSLDDTNQKILAGRLAGKTEREISETVPISNVAVHKRIRKMQTALAAMLQ